MERQRFALELLSLNGPMFTRQLAASLEMTTGGARGLCTCLARHGLIVSVAGLHGITEKGLQSMSAENLPCSQKGKDARLGSLRQRAWNLMRIRDSFKLDDLLEALCDGSEKSAPHNLRSYCMALHRVGILGMTRRSGAWFLPKGHGPLAPAYNKVERYVLDRNTGELFRLGREVPQ